MSEEKKGNGLFWLALLIFGGGAAWAINKYIVAPKKDTTIKDNPTVPPSHVTPPIITPPFDYSTFLNGKWVVQYLQNSNLVAENVRFILVANDKNNFGYDNGDGNDYKCSVVYVAPKKQINISVTNTSSNTKMPIETLTIDSVAGTMSGTDANGLVLNYYKVGVSVIPTIQSNGTVTIQPITDNVTYYQSNGWNLDTTTHILSDENGYMIGDGVVSYDENKWKVTYSNGYYLDCNSHELYDNKGVQVIQKLNPNNLPLSEYVFSIPNSIYGYSSLHNIIFYNDDLTPYSIIDGDSVLLVSSSNAIAAQDEFNATTGQLINKAVPITSITKSLFYTNIKVYNAFNNCADIFSSFYYIKSTENQSKTINPILTIEIIGDNNKVFYKYSTPTYIYTLYKDNNCVGYGVDYFDFKNKEVYFPSRMAYPVFLNLDSNILTGVSINGGLDGYIVNNVDSYVSGKVFEIAYKVQYNGTVIKSNVSDDSGEAYIIYKS